MPGAAVGALRSRVTIQYRSGETADGQGGRVVTWSDLATSVAAQVRSLRGAGSEQFLAGAVGAHQKYEVEIRHRADVTSKMRVVWTPYHGSAKTLEIGEVQIVGLRSDRLVLRCAEVA